MTKNPERYPLVKETWATTSRRAQINPVYSGDEIVAVVESNFTLTELTLSGVRYERRWRNP
jgi:hypothetical protein